MFRQVILGGRYVKPTTRLPLCGEYLMKGRTSWNVLCQPRAFPIFSRSFHHGVPALRRLFASDAQSKKEPSKEVSESVKEHIMKSRRSHVEAVEDDIKKTVNVDRPVKENIRTIMRIIRLGKPDLKWFLVAIGFIMFAVLYPTVSVRLVGNALDAYAANRVDADGDLLIAGYKYTTIFALMVPFMAVSAVCFWARLWVLKVLGERLVARLRTRVMRLLVRHDSAFYDQDKNKVGDLISRLSSDAYVVSRSITLNLPDGLKNLLFGIISSYMMYTINPLLFGVMLLISPPITFGLVWYGERIRLLSTRMQNVTAGLTKVSEETLNAIKLVKAFTGEQRQLTRYAEQLRRVVSVAKQEALAQSNYQVSIYSLYHTGYLSCTALGLYLIINGKMSTGDVVAFTMYLEFFNMALYSLTTTYMELMKGAGAGVKLFQLIDYKSDVPAIRGKHIPANLGNDVEFKNVAFSYPLRPNDQIFKDCSFKVGALSSTCFVAPSGCGKSTIAALLLRSYNPSAGEICIGGMNINQFQVRDLRHDIIGIVQQEPILLSGTILENIVYGLTPKETARITLQDVILVAKQANCHDFIMSFPQGYDTYIGLRGASLLGGQKQRIAIARALMKRPRILILDEATSALDIRSESLINDTLKDLTTQGKMTIISIAHRLSTISKSENVVVLGKRGQVVELGRFAALFADPGSELSKLLDEPQKEKPALSEEGDLASNTESKLKDDTELVRTLLSELPQQVRDTIISEHIENAEKQSEPVS